MQGRGSVRTWGLSSMGKRSSCPGHDFVRQMRMVQDPCAASHTWGLSSTGKRSSLPSAERTTLPSTTGLLRASACAYRGPMVYT